MQLVAPSAAQLGANALLHLVVVEHARAPLRQRDRLDRVFEIIEEECARLREERPGDILSPQINLRVTSFQENRLVIKIMGDVVAGKHWELSGVLRRRIKSRLDAEGLSMAGVPIALPGGAVVVAR